MPSDSVIPNVALIAALDENRVIGRGPDIPWHIPEDMRYFKRMTLGKPVIMGRKTFDSIGKPLPGRRNIVVTRRTDRTAEGAEVVNTLEAALKLAATSETDEIMVAGGAEVYSQALARAQTLYLTYIHAAFEGDVYFPELNEDEWFTASREERQTEDGLAYSWVTLTRAKPG